MRPLVVVVAAALLVTSPALAAPTKVECAVAYQKGQEQRRDGELLAAEKSFALCSDAACPSALRADCAPWRAQVAASTPSLAIAVSVASARVKLDGELVSPGVVMVDPGAHVIRAEADGHEPAEVTLKVRVGERDVPVSLTLARKAAQAPPHVASSSSAARPVPASTIGFGALGVVALGAFGYFGLHGNGLRDDLASCKPACDPTRVDDIKRAYVVADVALGAGVLMLGLATYSFVTRPHSPTTPRVGGAITTTGVALSLGGTF